MRLNNDEVGVIQCFVCLHRMLYVNLFLLMYVTDDMLNLFCVCVSRLVKFFSGFSGKNLEFFCYRENEK